MTYAAARVASLAAAAETAETSATVASITASTLRACTSNMPNLSATVAFRTRGSEPGAVATIVLSAITGNMTFQTTFVA